MTRVAVLAALVALACGAPSTVDGGPASDAGFPPSCSTMPIYLDGSPEGLPIAPAWDAGTLPSPDTLPPQSAISWLTFRGDNTVVPRSHDGTFAFSIDTVASRDNDTGMGVDTYVYLDDMLAQPFVAGAQRPHLHRDFIDSRSHIDFELRGVAPGLHTMTMVGVTWDSAGTVLTPGVGYGVTLVYERSEWADLIDTPGTRTVPPPPNNVWDTRVGDPRRLHGPPDADGMMHLRIFIGVVDLSALQCQSDYTVWGGFAVFLDGRPIRPVGATRDMLTAPVTPFEARAIDVDVGPLPVDGTFHRLDLVHFGGLRSPGVLDLAGTLAPYGSGGFVAQGDYWSN